MLSTEIQQYFVLKQGISELKDYVFGGLVFVWNSHRIQFKIQDT